MLRVFLYIFTLIFFYTPMYSKQSSKTCIICEENCGRNFQNKKNWTPAEIRLEMSNNKHLVFERSGESILKLYLDHEIMTYSKDTLNVTRKIIEEQSENPFYTVKHYFNFLHNGHNIFRIGCYCCAECGKKCE